MCVLIFSTTSVCSTSHSKKYRARYDQKCIIDFRVKCPLFLSDFNKTFIFKIDLRNLFKYQILCKSDQWDSSSMRTGRHEGPIQTYMTKLTVALRNSANAPRKCYKNRSRSGKLRPKALVWGPTTAQCGSVGALSKKFVTYRTTRLLQIHFWRDTITAAF
jgi:hypothetical protein